MFYSFNDYITEEKTDTESKNHKCDLCGFYGFLEIKKFIEENNPKQVLHICQHCKEANDAKKIKESGVKGSWIWLPEMSQEETIWLIRWFSLSVYSDKMGGYLDAPRKMLLQWILHRVQVGKIIREKVGTPKGMHWIPFIFQSNKINWFPYEEMDKIKNWERSIAFELPSMSCVMNYISD